MASNLRIRLGLPPGWPKSEYRRASGAGVSDARNSRTIYLFKDPDGENKRTPKETIGTLGHEGLHLVLGWIGELDASYDLDNDNVWRALDGYAWNPLYPREGALGDRVKLRNVARKPRHR